MEAVVRIVMYLFLIMAAIAAVIMIAIAIGTLYLFSLSLGKTAKFEFDEIYEIAIFVYFFEAFTMAIGFFVIWMRTGGDPGTFWTALGALVSGLCWPVSLFFCFDSHAYTSMALWATGAAVLAAQVYVITKVLRKTRRTISG